MISAVCAVLLALAAMLPSQGAIATANPRLIGDGFTAPGAIGSSMAEGYASYCKPTATKCIGWDRKVLWAAVPGYPGKPFSARVCRESTGKCIVVRVISPCACGTHVIDLTPYAMSLLARDWESRGVVRVTVTWPILGDGPTPTPPPTDTEETP